MKLPGILLTVLVLLTTTASPTWALDPGWALSLGIFDTARDGDPEAGIEYRFEPFRVQRGWLAKFPLKPALGLSATTEGNFWFYGGLRHDFALNKRFRLTPQFAIALYEDGDGKDLGGALEFRTGLELAYRLANGTRLGVAFYHLSNASIYDHNPGSNSLVLTWSGGR